MRLIDADHMKQIVTAVALAEKCDDRFISDMCGLIDCQPTAYDVDKVVERLEESKYEDELYPCNLAVEIEEAERIVKSGGID